MQDLEKTYRWAANAPCNRRGDYPSVTVGFSYGGGQRVCHLFRVISYPIRFLPQA